MNLKDLLPTYRPENEYSFDYTFTIFTPIYNRADTLHRVFTSLNAQTFKDFELVMINDGSTDNSHDVALTLIKTASFKVNYINNKINKHKMACFIQAIKVAKGEFVLPLDSDDECTPNALQVFYDEYQNIPEEKKEHISGVTCLCEDQYGNLVGEKFPESPHYSNTFKRSLNAPKASEKWGFTKTQILKGININEKIYAKGYIPEGVIWELIAANGYETKYINDILRVYYMDTENRISIQNHKNDAFGMAIYLLSVLNWFHKDYFLSKPSHFFKRIYTLLRASHFLNFKRKEYQDAIENKILKSLFLLGWSFKHLLK